MQRQLIALTAATLIGSTAQAQSTTPVSPGWSAFAGCWTPVVADGKSASTDAHVCVVPVSANDADLVSIAADKVTERTRISADGRHHEVTRQGCTGWESAEFSSDGRRLFLGGEQDCGGIKRKTSGIFAMGQEGRWLNVVNVAADSGNDLRVAKYLPMSATSAIPQDVAAALDARALSDRTARVAARADVSVAAVIEASKYLRAPVLEGWLSELGQDFRLDDKALIRLADGGVAPSVIDVMVATSNPQMFSVRTTGSGAAPSANDVPRRANDERDCVAPVFDPWGYYAYDPCDPYRQYGYYGTRGYRYGYNPYYGYGAYDPYGYGYGGYYAPVTVIVRGSANDPDKGHGRMTKDGYQRGTQTSSSGTAAAADRAPARESAPSTSSSSGSGSQGSSGSSGSSSSGSSSGRTATRKPPTT